MDLNLSSLFYVTYLSYLNKLSFRSIHKSFYYNLLAKQKNDLAFELTKNHFPLIEFSNEKLKFYAHASEHMHFVYYDSKIGKSHFFYYKKNVKNL